MFTLAGIGGFSFKPPVQKKYVGKKSETCWWSIWWEGTKPSLFAVLAAVAANK